MGLIRKMASISTLGAIKYTSRREAETKERVANARAAKAQEKLLNAQRRSAEAEESHKRRAGDVPEGPSDS